MPFRASFSSSVNVAPPYPEAPPVSLDEPLNADQAPNEDPPWAADRHSASTSLSAQVNLSLDGGEDAEGPELPPPYDVARIPDHPVTYTFSRLSVSSSAMVLLPPSDAADQQPLYHISVGLDPFMPTSHITSVRRGGTENGAYVGGIRRTTGPATFRFEANSVSIRRHEYPLFRMFSKFSVSKGVYLFTWDSGGKRELLWSCPGFPAARTYTCRQRHDASTIYAEFTPARQFIRPSRSHPKSKLTLTPEGHAIFDDVLVSTLLLERYRLTEV